MACGSRFRSRLLECLLFMARHGLGWGTSPRFECVVNEKPVRAYQEGEVGQVRYVLYALLGGRLG